ncbi:hypothetical protein CLV24_10296 [Pontibacter ummariensis]|uniref:Uncharacterized protein n=2 Tax=Pontibacter ummariensis TaxID=1610492 RepID=A0A239C4M2_9BACT|nr:hypothetical protein CLV24_10296 [Pontibacter ummariensis]SNS14591.1 hypothetical protein SAMN06296052_102317 [Pontibacter ummariensis]
MNYGNFSRSYRQEGHNNHRHWRFHGREHAHLGDTYNEPGEHYRLQKSQQYGREGGRAGTHDDRYREMYDTSNYTYQPRSIDYGLPRGAENDLDRVEYFPYQEGPYAGRPRNYTYKMGYNPNYDNPEEGDRYRDFDSRGNHGFRHDRGYSSDGGFSEFGDDRYGDPNDVSTHYYGHFGGYNR